MKIQVDDICLNKSYLYLSKALKDYGDEFLEKINSVFKVAFGIGDMLLINNGVIYEQHIFVLINTNKAKKHFKIFIEYIRNHESYEDDYVFDDVLKGNLHMVVIKLPKKHYNAIHWFKKSVFSKMFNQEDIEKYFKDKKEKLILIKDKNYKIEYTEQLNKEWGTNIKPCELEGELELPIITKEEHFD
jgi:hypothetical protein